ncbi:MAG: hypothetical protein L0H63_00265 [Nitrococcus sp.]|nr:hypothetical protein [Nitrococcus sp.]
MARAAIESINKAQNAILQHAKPTDAQIYADAASRVIALYQHRVHSEVPDANDALELRKADAAERSLRLAALAGERREILKQTQRRRISDETARKLRHEIDLLESRYR